MPDHDPQSADVRRHTQLRHRTVPTLQRGSWFAKPPRPLPVSRRGSNGLSGDQRGQSTWVQVGGHDDRDQAYLAAQDAVLRTIAQIDR